MQRRIHSISHQGKKILFVDFSHGSAGEVENIARTVPDHVTAQPRGSVLVLVDFTGASLSREAIRVLKESAVFDKPYVKKSAWIGAGELPPDFSREIKAFSGRKLPEFATREEALAWLVAD